MTKYSLKKSWLVALSVILTSGVQASAKIGDWSKILDSGSGDKYIKGTSDGGSNLARFFGGTIMFISPFLGMYLIIQLILAGYEWFTSAGEAEKIKTAQKRIRNAIIGVVVIVAMYTIASFIYNMLSSATNYGTIQNY